ncbi:LOW QUALITY PROTEIN: hypothetical protein KIPB_003281 [Kipferlia bialata]|uniref:Uncharacterized protein n=1 Tax=Kipferlia bialata TaxID=797122 RepID=A0A9K3CTN2_9EUKA|nr:LOW QUALITY PROTEIN: hypothetical protein KIPB_003281 [Kipferlia bialata]
MSGGTDNRQPGKSIKVDANQYPEPVSADYVESVSLLEVGSYVCVFMYIRREVVECVLKETQHQRDEIQTFSEKVLAMYQSYAESPSASGMSPQTPTSPTSPSRHPRHPVSDRHGTRSPSSRRLGSTRHKGQAPQSQTGRDVASLSQEMLLFRRRLNSIEDTFPTLLSTSTRASEAVLAAIPRVEALEAVANKVGRERETLQGEVSRQLAAVEARGEAIRQEMEGEFLAIERDVLKRLDQCRPDQNLFVAAAQSMASDISQAVDERVAKLEATTSASLSTQIERERQAALADVQTAVEEGERRIASALASAQAQVEADRQRALAEVETERTKAVADVETQRERAQAELTATADSLSQRVHALMQDMADERDAHLASISEGIADRQRQAQTACTAALTQAVEGVQTQVVQGIEASLTDAVKERVHAQMLDEGMANGVGAVIRGIADTHLEEIEARLTGQVLARLRDVREGGEGEAESDTPTPTNPISAGDLRAQLHLSARQSSVALSNLTQDYERLRQRVQLMERRRRRR